MEGITVRGKTGTAQAPNIVVDGDKEAGTSARIVRSGDHSWFVMLVGRDGERPRYAVAVVVDYGGSGGRVAGPIANQILRALRDEGYL
jgi:cell division protein FtsI/penicillin-binding protein 2